MIRVLLMDDGAVGNTETGTVRLVVSLRSHPEHTSKDDDWLVFDQVVDAYCAQLKLNTPAMAVGELTKEELVEFMLTYPNFDYINMVNF